VIAPSPNPSLVFEIGQQLAEQRRRRSLSLAECEHATKIRAKFLAALEDDRIEGLPDPAYGRIFLRDYARFLGLDAEALVTEFDERHGALATPAEHQVVAPEPPPPPGQGVRLAGQIATLRGISHPRLAWLGIGAALALGGLIWLGETGSAPPTAANTSSQQASVRPGPLARPHHVVPTTSVPLVLTGTGSAGSYVLIRRSDAGGLVVWEGTLSGGTSVHLEISQPLWMRVGWTPRLHAVLGDQPVTLTGGTADFMVTRTGVNSTT